MHPIPSTCPVCHNQLTATKLHCHHCQTSIEGQFSLGMLHKLTAEQLRFVEVFLVCEGKINRVEQELGLSYPAVRSRLQEVVEALGREMAPPAPLTPPAYSYSYVTPPTPPAPPARPAMADDLRRELLAKVSAGEITAQEAAERLRQG
ncbi:MAG: DUF2089 domain-containing protein [Chloroflexi bacterium]|nr:DUF2089 domain-containing protein [Chloroflexota bacterium]